MYNNVYPNGYDDYDGFPSESQESEESEQTQPTQIATQPLSQQSQPDDTHLWGYLKPINNQLTRIDFWRSQLLYTIGRHAVANNVVFPGCKVSNKHCEIYWDGQDSSGCAIVHDFSSNGTFINGVKIGKNRKQLLRDGNEIAFGSPAAQPQTPLEDYRFIYRHTAGGPPSSGFYAFYDIGNELGKGSFATVIRAMHRETGVWYAVKMIKDKHHRTLGDGAIKNQAIVREINIMEKLKHPNICELKEVFMEENSNDINLVLELVEGGDLLEYILSREGLDETQTKHITFQICNALSYIHAEGITHRDLKPENVLLTRDDPPIVKVADFGLAKIVDSLTMLRTMCGTPSYLAPEVVKQVEDEGYSSVVDSWSVGVIVFSMLTNSSPFIEDENQTNLRTRIIERTIDWATLENRHVSPECFHFIECLLEEDATKRMTLTDALSHPWLQSYIPIYPTPQLRVLPRNNNSLPRRAGLTHDMLGMNLRSHQGTSQREPSRAPLQRRSDILSQAAEGTRSVPQPSDEMIANANAAEQRRGKRGRANLTALEEEEEDSDEAGPSTATPKGGQQGTTRSKRQRLRSEA